MRPQLLINYDSIRDINKMFVKSIKTNLRVKVVNATKTKKILLLEKGDTITHINVNDSNRNGCYVSDFPTIQKLLSR